MSPLSGPRATSLCQAKANNVSNNAPNPTGTKRKSHDMSFTTTIRGSIPAGGSCAFGVYVRDPHAAIAHANGLLVLTLTGGQISAMTRFDNSALPSFGFPRTLPIAARWQPPDRS